MENASKVEVEARKDLAAKAIRKAQNSGRPVHPSHLELFLKTLELKKYYKDFFLDCLTLKALRELRSLCTEPDLDAQPGPPGVPPKPVPPNIAPPSPNTFPPTPEATPKTSPSQSEKSEKSEAESDTNSDASRARDHDEIIGDVNVTPFDVKYIRPDTGTYCHCTGIFGNQKASYIDVEITRRNKLVTRPATKAIPHDTVRLDFEIVSESKENHSRSVRCRVVPKAQLSHDMVIGTDQDGHDDSEEEDDPDPQHGYEDEQPHDANFRPDVESSDNDHFDDDLRDSYWEDDEDDEDDRSSIECDAELRIRTQPDFSRARLRSDAGRRASLRRSSSSATDVTQGGSDFSNTPILTMEAKEAGADMLLHMMKQMSTHDSPPKQGATTANGSDQHVKSIRKQATPPLNDRSKFMSTQRKEAQAIYQKKTSTRDRVPGSERPRNRNPKSTQLPVDKSLPTGPGRRKACSRVNTGSLGNSCNRNPPPNRQNVPESVLGEGSGHKSRNNDQDGASTKLPGRLKRSLS